MTRGNHSDLISDQGPWYSTKSKDYISPSLTQDTESFPAPVPRQRGPGRHRKSGKKKDQAARKIQPRYIFAATLTAILAVPALWMADYISTHNGNEDPSTVLVNKNAYMPMTLYANGTRTPICVYVTETGDDWKAWATNQAC
jgi:hypothetical protein